jgi:hypothetical protein
MPSLAKLPRNIQTTMSIDISRSSFEEEGLKISTNSRRRDYRSDSRTRPAARRTVSLHTQSISGTPCFSTASSPGMGKPDLRCVQPMRQVPGTFTARLSQSCQTFPVENEGSERRVSAEPERSAHAESDPLRSSVRGFATQTPRHSLQMHDSSFTRIPSISQTNLTGRTSFGYSRDNNSSLEAASPVSRSSLDFVFRSKTRTSMDPISRAATIQAARQAFEEKEAAKARKLEEQQSRAEEKQMRRKGRQDWRSSLTVADKQDPKNVLSEKSSATEEIDSHPDRPQRKSNPGSWKSESKTTWMLFLTWLRTRVFKLRRKMQSWG